MVFIPARGSGTTSGWVHPRAVQTGQWIADRGTGTPIQLRGAVNGSASGYPFTAVGSTTFLAMLQTLGGNHLSTHMSWGDMEPYRPLGGNQLASTPTWTTRDFSSSPAWAALEKELVWTDANGIYVIVMMAGANNNTNQNSRYPDWCFDDSLWATCTTAKTAVAGGTQTAPNAVDGNGYYPSWTLNTTSVTTLAAGAVSNGTAYPRKGWAVIGGQTIAYSNWAGTTMTVDAGFYTPGATFAQNTTISVGTDISVHQAPFPQDRSTYLSQSTTAATAAGATLGVTAGWATAAGAYNLTADDDQRNAQYAANATQVVGGLNNNITWHGDFGSYDAYMRSVNGAVMAASGKHASVLGYKWFNEPNIGKLANNHQIGNAGGAWNTQTAVLNQVVLPNFASHFDALRVLDPERFICFSGQGGPNQQVSTDFSVLWSAGHTGGGPTACPIAFPFVQESHFYFGGVGLPSTPMDSITSADPDLPTDDSVHYAPDGGAGTATSIPQIFQAVAASAAARNVPWYVGEWGIGPLETLNGSTPAATAYITDYGTGFSLTHGHQAYYNLAQGGGRGLLNVGSLTLSNTGTAYQTYLATPLSPLPTPPVAGSADWPQLIVEIAFTTGPLSATPAWVDVSNDVVNFSTQRGRSDFLASFNPGTATVRLGNQYGFYDQDNSSGPLANHLQVGKRMRIRAQYPAGTGTIYPIFDGYINSYAPSVTLFEEWVDIAATDMFLVLNLYPYRPVSAPTELTGARLDRILAAISGSISTSFTDAGQSVIPAVSIDQPLDVQALAYIQQLEQTEYGSFYISADGNPHFEGRYYRAFTSRCTTPQATFGNTGSDLEYGTDISTPWDDSALWNQALITDATGAVYQYDDATSQSTYLLRSYQNSILTQTPNEAMSQAQWIVQNSKAQRFGVSGMTIEPIFDAANLWPAVLGREMSDLITFHQTKPSGVVVSHDAFVEGISHSAGDGLDPWTVQFTLQIQKGTLPQFWVLGTGTLGTTSGSLNTVLSY